MINSEIKKKRKQKGAGKVNFFVVPVVTVAAAGVVPVIVEQRNAASGLPSTTLRLNQRCKQLSSKLDVDTI